MSARIFIACLAAVLLTSGCAKSFSTGKSADQHSRLNFHSRDMVVPDFNSGRTVRCPDVHTQS